MILFEGRPDRAVRDDEIRGRIGGLPEIFAHRPAENRMQDAAPARLPRGTGVVPDQLAAVFSDVDLACPLLELVVEGDQEILKIGVLVATTDRAF